MSETDTKDSGMYRMMGLVIGALLLLTLVIVFAARGLGESEDPTNKLVRQALLERIGPVASVRTTADAPAEGAPSEAEPAVAAALSGPEIVEAHCAACHAAGVAGAPRADDAAAWAERREAGLEALVASVINGKGAMPARAGTQLSDEELHSAVIALAGFEAEAAPDTAGGEGVAVEAPAEEAAPATEVAPAAEQPEAGADGEAAGAAAAAVAGGGELTVEIKNSVDGLCAGCHLAGVANAPKIGDKEAWAARMELGMDALVASVVSGKGAMPPRGGSALTDEQIPVAIDYLMNK